LEWTILALLAPVSCIKDGLITYIVTSLLTVAGVGETLEALLRKPA